MPLEIGAIAKAFEAGAKLWNTYLVSADKRKSDKCKEAGEQYIKCNEGEGEYKNFDEDKKKKYLKHFYKRFFHFN